MRATESRTPPSFERRNRGGKAYEPAPPSLGGILIMTRDPSFAKRYGGQAGHATGYFLRRRLGAGRRFLMTDRAGLSSRRAV